MSLVVKTVLLALGPAASLAGTIAGRHPAPWTNFNNNTVFVPPSSWNAPRTFYARSLQLPDHSLLVTQEIYKPGPNLSLPIYRSKDGGATWSQYSLFIDKVNGWGMRYQPFLYTLPISMGGFPAGTILAAGTSIPLDFSQAYIDLYASTDGGKNFDFVSHIAYGPGPESTDNGDKAIWEAFLLVNGHTLICYYSDQRDPKHGQKLVHQTTTDLKNWTKVVNDVALPDVDARPGMAVVAYSPKSKKWIMTFENCGGPISCQANYKLTRDPLEFQSQSYHPIVANDSSNASPLGSPYVAWAPRPGAKDGSGIFIANGDTDGAVYINDDNALPQNWKRVDVGEANAYSRSLRIITSIDGSQKLLIAGASQYGKDNTDAVMVGVVDIPV